MRSVIALSACVLLSVPASVRAQTGPVGLEITPSQTEVDLVGRSYRTTLTLFNHDPTTYTIDLSIEALGHDLDGAPEYLPSSAVTGAFSLGAGSFSLAQGQKRTVSLNGAIPASERSIYFGVIAEYKGANQQQGTSVETHTRIASEFLLRGPKPWTERLQVIDVGVVPGPEKKATLYAVVKNIGNVHARPTGRFTVYRGGRPIATLPFALNAAHKPGAVIPDYARRYTAPWSPPAGLTGTFTVTATTAQPAASASKNVSFSEGRALAPDAKIANLSVQNRGGLTVDTAVTNVGGAALSGARLTLVATQDGRFERGRTVFPVETLRPGSTIEKHWAAGALPDGAYRVTATLQQGTTVLDERVAGIRIGAAPTSRARGPLIWIAGALLLVLFGLLFWFFVLKRRSEEEEETPARARAT
ncbi:MAG: hypothetical protein ACXVEX_08025 [Actinomycetota bacterium]